MLFFFFSLYVWCKESMLMQKQKYYYRCQKTKLREVWTVLALPYQVGYISTAQKALTFTILWVNGKCNFMLLLP